MCTYAYLLDGLDEIDEDLAALGLIYEVLTKHHADPEVGPEFFAACMSDAESHAFLRGLAAHPSFSDVDAYEAAERAAKSARDERLLEGEALLLSFNGRAGVNDHNEYEITIYHDGV